MAMMPTARIPVPGAGIEATTGSSDGFRSEGCGQQRGHYGWRNDGEPAACGKELPPVIEIPIRVGWRLVVRLAHPSCSFSAGPNRFHQHVHSNMFASGCEPIPVRAALRPRRAPQSPRGLGTVQQISVSLPHCILLPQHLFQGAQPCEPLLELKNEFLGENVCWSRWFDRSLHSCSLARLSPTRAEHCVGFFSREISLVNVVLFFCSEPLASTALNKRFSARWFPRSAGADAFLMIARSSVSRDAHSRKLLFQISNTSAQSRALRRRRSCRDNRRSRLRRSLMFDSGARSQRRTIML